MHLNIIILYIISYKLHSNFLDLNKNDLNIKNVVTDNINNIKSVATFSFNSEMKSLIV